MSRKVKLQSGSGSILTGRGGFHILTGGLAPVMGGPGLDDGIEVAH